jgi:ATP-dependent Clp protease ATP-binding subunit ClpB
MNLSNFTIQASEIVQSAQQAAFNAGNPTIEAEHVLKAMLEQKNSPVEYLLKKNNVSIQVLNSKLDEAIKKLPKTSGEPAQSLSRDANTVFLKAGSLLSKFNDEFVTPEHILMAMAGGSDAAARMLKEPNTGNTIQCAQ